MHAKTDSDVTSLAPSSPNRAVYYVQSPSRDSHDGEKTTNSFHSTPILSPMGSPGRQSRDSSSTRYSGSLKPGSQKSSNGSRRHHHHHRKAEEKQWQEFDAIEEEGLLDEDGSRRGVPRRCYFPAFVLGFFVLFSFFSLILWGASRNQKPLVIMKVCTSFQVLLFLQYFFHRLSSIFYFNFLRVSEFKIWDCFFFLISAIYTCIYLKFSVLIKSSLLVRIG